MAEDNDPPSAEVSEAEGSEAAGGRLLRVGGDRGLSLSERLVARVSTTLYRSPLHRLRLRGRFPLRLLAVPDDPVPGNAAVGERLMAGRMIHAGHTAMTRDLRFDAPGHPPAWRDWANGWQWLRDLAAHSDDARAAANAGDAGTEGNAGDAGTEGNAGDAGRRAQIAEPLVTRWLQTYGAYDPVAWRPDVTGRRLLSAFGHAPLILSSPNQVYRSAVLSALATWARHLDRAAFRLPDGMAKAEALAGLYAAGVLIPGGEARAVAALAGLDALLGALVLPDGGIASRTPADALALADLLLLAGAAPASLATRAPPLFADTLARLVPSLRGLALGDGGVGAWHGSAGIAAAPLVRLARQCATGAALTRSGRWSGYYRLSAGKAVIVVDAGPPPAVRIASGGHAGTLAFEFSDGPARVITNCGGGGGLAAPLAAVLAAGLRTTAAHSTLVIADTNSTRIRDDGALGTGVEEVVVQLRASEAGQWLEASHDGYARRFGVLVRRRLFLSPDGNDLRGQDLVERVPGKLIGRRTDRAFDLRFHLGPGAAATPTADRAGALIKLPGGRVWAMKARFGPGGGQLAIEPSLWVAPDGVLHKTQQLVVSSRTEKGEASVGWSFRRAGK